MGPFPVQLLDMYHSIPDDDIATYSSSTLSFSDNDVSQGKPCYAA
jgi:hypothetical protein